MSEVEGTISVKVPPRIVPDELARGVYAMQMQQITTLSETILDFSSVTPVNYDTNEAGELNPDTFSIRAELVSRVIVPSRLLAEFIHSFIRAHPQVLQDIRVTDSGNGGGGES